jgi:hypothetical protein
MGPARVDDHDWLGTHSSLWHSLATAMMTLAGLAVKCCIGLTACHWQQLRCTACGVCTLLVQN